MGKIRKVDVDLYEFLKKQEVHLDEKNGEITMYAFIHFWDLEEFQRHMGSGWYSDEGLEVVLMHDYVSIPLNELLEYRGEYISSYLNCVDDEDEVNRYSSELEYED